MPNPSPENTVPQNSDPKAPGSAKSDFEDAMEVVQLDENTWEGVRPLRLPLSGARGVYGGHLCAQTLLVAMRSAPGYVPHSFHSHFLRPGDFRTKALYKVTNIDTEDGRKIRQIFLVQKGKITYTAMCSLIEKGTKGPDQPEPFVSPTLRKKYPDPSKLHQNYHTDFLRTAYSDEFLHYELCPEEQFMEPSERWVTVFGKMHQPEKKAMRDPMFNFVALADLTDAVVLTTLARVLHLDWNPTKNNKYEEYNEGSDARNMMSVSLNALHLFHYTAMSLDHNLYFHRSDFDEVDILHNWLTLTYQYQVSSSNRTLVRGFFLDAEDRPVATFVQEGLTYMRPGVPGKSGEKFSNSAKV